MSVLVPCVPPVSPDSLSSSIWGASASKIPQVVVGTVLTVPLDVVRIPRGGHQASRKGRKSTSVIDIDVSLRTVVITPAAVSCYLYHLINTYFFPPKMT